nr:C40 family peptidase [Lysinibacillus timonensis]
MTYQNIFRHVFITILAGYIYFVFDIEHKVMAEEKEDLDFTASEFRLTAKEYLDAPYSYGGTTESGFDCSGYVYKVFSDLDIELPRTSHELYNMGQAVKKDDLLPGDLVFFNTSGYGVSHVGIYYGDGKFIHSQSYKGVSISYLDDKWYWGDRYVGAKRVADVEVGT